MSNKINIRKIELKDYEFINKWWVKQGFKIPNKDILPNEGFGGIIIEKEKPIAAAYVYLTNSRMGYIDNLISDPKYVSKDRFDVIANLMAACKKMAEDVGCLDIWAITNNKGILKRCKKLGYNVTKTNYGLITYY